eukprot:scaffold543408_cov173-Attheya_sp.AAC.1
MYILLASARLCSLVVFVDWYRLRFVLLFSGWYCAEVPFALAGLVGGWLACWGGVADGVTRWTTDGNAAPMSSLVEAS